MSNRQFLLFICTLLHIIQQASSERINKKMYINLHHTSACFMRLNATGQFGCTSGMSGNIGVVYVIERDEDVEWLLKSAPNAPYIVMLDTLRFDMFWLEKMRDSGKVNGFMLAHYDIHSDNFTAPPSFSLDAVSPLEKYGLYSSHDSKTAEVKWNSAGNLMLFKDFGLPIFLILNKTEASDIIDKCYNKFNRRSATNITRAYPLCSAELYSGMYAATDSETCIRRSNHAANLNPQKYCDHLTDYNVVTTVRMHDEPRLNASVVLAATRIDTTSLFEGISPGADTSVTGIIALLAAAHALKTSGALDAIRDTRDKDLLFAFFNGETYDYIGSSRMVYDMENDKFPSSATDAKDTEDLTPINLHHLSHVIEVSQLGHADRGLWVHVDPISNKRPDIAKQNKNMTDFLKQTAIDLNLQLGTLPHSQRLPPASVQRFLMKHSLPAVVITDHEQAFTNMHYNSRLDLPKDIQASYPSHLNESERYDHMTKQAHTLTQVATLFARSILATTLPGTSTNHVAADPTEVAHLLYCFLFRGNCTLFQDASVPKNIINLPNTTIPLYVGVHTNSAIYASTIVSSLMAYYTGDRHNITEKECTKTRTNKTVNYSWMRGDKAVYKSGVCVSSMVRFTQAVSPAFVIDDYNWKSGLYSTWTESVWDTTTLRLFLVPSRAFQIATLMGGIIVLIVSHLVVYFLNRNISVILGNDFTSNVSTTTDT